jgi:hypothetical protein
MDLRSIFFKNFFIFRITVCILLYYIVLDLVGTNLDTIVLVHSNLELGEQTN